MLPGDGCDAKKAVAKKSKFNLKFRLKKNVRCHTKSLKKNTVVFFSTNYTFKEPPSIQAKISSKISGGNSRNTKVLISRHPA